LANVAELTKDEVAKMMDYSLLHPEWQDEHHLDGCKVMREYKFGAYYVLPYWIPLVVKEIGDFCEKNGLEIGTGIAFPYGSATTQNKLAESKNLIDEGVNVLDMVTNVGALKDKKYDYYENELKQFADLCAANGIISKAIIRNGYLTDEEIEVATELVVNAGLDYIKTATGQGPKGRPNINDVEIIKNKLDELNSDCKLKVSGVIEPRIINAYSFIQMGASRIGTRGAIKIVDALPLVQEKLYK